MTNVLIHDLPAGSQALSARLERVLRSTTDTRAAEILGRLRIEPRQKPRMVVTGQYSSGKSSLIKALSDGVIDPAIAADIATDEVTDYEWDGAVILVDTPGVQSGLRSHDKLALEAIGTADFVLFVITVNLFDNASRDYLRYLANELQLFGQMILVITQTSKQAAAEGIREKAVQEALGTSTFNLPIAEVDSVYYLRSLDGGARAEILRSHSGMDELRAIINKISEDRGELAQLRQPLHLVRQLCDEAQELFAEEPQAQSALTLLASQRAAITERRHMIEQALILSESKFKSACLVNVRAFVDTATTLPAGDTQADETLTAAETKLVVALDGHAEKFAHEINRLTEMQFDKLSERLLEIGQSNRALQLVRPEKDVELRGPDALENSHASASSDGRVARPVNWLSIADQLKKGQTWWGAGDGLKNASGSVGHNVVKDVGHVFGKKFKPWEALKVADKIGKAAKFGGFAIQIGFAGYEVLKDDRAARSAQIESERQHSAFVTEIMGLAEKIAADAREQLWEMITPPMDAFISDIQATQDEILGASESRGTASRELGLIASEADSLLAGSVGVRRPGERD
ncbi:GTPase [Salinibacterium sp. SWN1162]|uniref:GTPase n=1 Tax=Salinibacterium sp. SWN1162 TaxID=2792053 RepID=UPI0018CE6C08|nr:GTPase [Salinibacterium sp. SWN1162]MBH0009572.1 50S ribosome-binding GTPase [Salinibacterium sp. SWN1162]